MAEEALKKAAKELGVEIKVETNGAVGVENELTPQDIEEAVGVIIACDKDARVDRFVGKRVIEVSVKAVSYTHLEVAGSYRSSSR